MIWLFGNFFISSLIGYNSLTRPSFNSFCMSVTGLKTFESSHCVFKSPTRSDRKFGCMSCLVLRNSLTIKSLFFGSVISRNARFLLAISFLQHGFEHGFDYHFIHGFEHDFEHSFEHDFEHGFERSFQHGFEHGFEYGFEHELKSETNLISTKQSISSCFYITSISSCECFKLK